MDLPVKRERDLDSSSLMSSKRLCKDLDVAELEELEAEPFEEELVSNVMKSLEQEIQTHSSVSDDLPNKSEYGSMSDVSEEGRGGRSYDIDIDYLLEATDIELGIPPSPTTELLQLTTKEEFDNLFEKGMEDVLQLCLYGDVHAEAESVGLVYEDEDWMSRPLSEGLFEAPHL